jgi:nucleoside-diphosphate-sugar epimerase
MSSNKTALVLGATGGIGGEVARALLHRGWQVRALTRNPARVVGGDLDGVAWIAGDAMRAEDVMAAAQGADILFHGVNPPGYQNWRGLAIPMLRHSIAAAIATGARLIYPGSVYNFGPDAWPLCAEDSPQHPRTRKGGIRVEMEAMLRAAVPQGLRFLTVRAGDFFGPKAPSSWVTKLMMAGGKPLRAVTTPEVPGIGHAWAYLPDLAETIARLAEREAEVPAAETFHFGGHFLPGRQMAEAVRRAAGQDGLPVRGFRWLPVYLGAPFVTFLREVMEMRYLWREEIRLDNRRLLAFLGQEPQTALDAAVEATLRGVRASGEVVTSAPARASSGSKAAASQADSEAIGARHDGSRRLYSLRTSL